MRARRPGVDGRADGTDHDLESVHDLRQAQVVEMDVRQEDAIAEGGHQGEKGLRAPHEDQPRGRTPSHCGKVEAAPGRTTEPGAADGEASCGGVASREESVKPGAEAEEVGPRRWATAREAVLASGGGTGSGCHIRDSTLHGQVGDGDGDMPRPGAAGWLRQRPTRTRFFLIGGCSRSGGGDSTSPPILD